jgi:hypothetical protein
MATDTTTLQKILNYKTKTPEQKLRLALQPDVCSEELLEAFAENCVGKDSADLCFNRGPHNGEEDTDEGKNWAAIENYDDYTDWTPALLAAYVANRNDPEGERSFEGQVVLLQQLLDSGI